MLKWFRKKAHLHHDDKLNVDQFPESKQLAKNIEDAKQRLNIIGQYGEFVITSPASPGKIYDTRALPFQKEHILDALCMQIIVTEDQEMREHLRTAAICLVDFQEGVGPEPASMLGVDLPQFELDKDELLKMATKIAGHSERGRHETFRAKPDIELEEIQARLQAAEQLRQVMPEEKKVAVLAKNLV